MEYIRVLLASQCSQFLVSAYDIHKAKTRQKKKIIALLKSAKRRGVVIFLDSGSYESFWKCDKSWTPGRYASVLKYDLYHMAFCFDNQDPPRSKNRIVKEVEDGLLRNQRRAAKGTVIPIVHAPLKILPEVVAGVAGQLNPILVAGVLPRFHGHLLRLIMSQEGVMGQRRKFSAEYKQEAVAMLDHRGWR